MNKRWLFLAALSVSLYWSSPVYGLKFIENDGFYVYYPAETGSLAQRLAGLCPVMASFLEDRGLPLNKPVHIVLDADLDEPEVITKLYPHREIRIPMRAPGVLEDGYLEPDPWRCFLFKGLSHLAIYNERSGLPASAYFVFGEIISPNAVLPDWAIDGISHLLYEHYSLRSISDPMAEAIFAASAIPDLDRVSHHPEVWPGKFSYRIYGRPFVHWLHERYGWDRLLLFLRLHGRGIIPLEIDMKAKRAFNMSWSRLWQLFQTEHTPLAYNGPGIPITGYWDHPYFYWNETGVYPGLLEPGRRGRYGFLDRDGWLWLSEYVQEGISRIRIERQGTKHFVGENHVWDPGPGAVAVSRQGINPILILFGSRNTTSLFGDTIEDIPILRRIDGPPGALQLSGPVMDDQGRIAVAANNQGNWDIWLYDGHWYQVTDAPTIEMDPWWIGDRLAFSSNASGRFQIHGTDMHPLTNAPLAAILPRNTTYLELTSGGFQHRIIDVRQMPLLSDKLVKSQTTETLQADESGNSYSAWKSIWSNYLVPDYYFDSDTQQLGISTKGLDVSRSYAWNAGIRYSFDQGETSWRLGYRAEAFSTRVTRYPFRYSTLRDIAVDEMRLDLKLAWSPLRLKALELSANWRRYKPEGPDERTQELSWANIQWKDDDGHLRTLANLDFFDDDSQSLYGEVQYFSGRKLNTIIRIRGGKTWGELNSGHNSFRIGGTSGEGFFTQRAARLFPLRGFDSNILDAGQAACVSMEMVMPLFRIQTGYKTLPLFLHNIHLGSFVDTGFAAEHYASDEILVSAGFELVTGMELAWDIMSRFSVGLAWPLKQPEDLNQSGPLLLIQIGRPL